MGKAKKHTREQRNPVFPIVTSDVCRICMTPCVTGLNYKAKMDRKGSIGRGVVCKKEIKNNKNKVDKLV